MIRVLIADDSAVARLILRRALSEAPDIEIIGEAQDPYEARDLIVELEPDVLVLDVEMPRMDGITFLRQLSKHYPIPTVVCSTLTHAGGRLAMEAYDAGAVEVICKPERGRIGPEFVTAVRAAAQSQKAPPSTALHTVSVEGSIDIEVVVIGASTGGTVAVEAVLRQLPKGLPPIAVVQHMPAYITRAFAERLNGVTAVEVAEAIDGKKLESGHAYIAPGDKHLTIERTAQGLMSRLRQGPRVNGHRPSVDVLFESVAKNVGTRAVAALLTGMGKDGAEGLLSLRQGGAHTLAQDEASCVVFGMPRAAIELGAAIEVTPLDRVASRIAVALRAREQERRVSKRVAG